MRDTRLCRVLRSQGKTCALQQAQGAYLLNLVLLVLAPEVDLGYSGLYGLLLDQGTSSQPTAGGAVSDAVDPRVVQSDDRAVGEPD